MNRSMTVVLPTPASPDTHTIWRRPVAAAPHPCLSRASTSVRPIEAGVGADWRPFTGAGAASATWEAAGFAASLTVPMNR